MYLRGWRFVDWHRRVKSAQQASSAIDLGFHLEGYARAVVDIQGIPPRYWVVPFLLDAGCLDGRGV